MIRLVISVSDHNDWSRWTISSPAQFYGWRCKKKVNN
jgi:hypothetical protein